MGTEFEGFTWPERFIVISTHADFHPFGFTSNAYVADPREWAAVVPHAGAVAARVPGAPGEDEAEVLACRGGGGAHAALRAAPGSLRRAVQGHLSRASARGEGVAPGRILLAGDAAHLNNPLGAFGLNGGLHDAFRLAESLGRVYRGEADEDLLDLYVRKRRTANIDFVQTQSISNKKMLEEADPAKPRADLRRAAPHRGGPRGGA